MEKLTAAVLTDEGVGDTMGVDVAVVVTTGA